MSSLDIPEATGPVDDETALFASELVERSGVVARAEALLARSTGRPRTVPVHAVLTALVCLALEGRALLLTAATDLLHRRLSERVRTTLGTAGPPLDRLGFLARYRCVRYCFHLLVSTMDPSSLPKNRRLSQEELSKRARKLDKDAEVAARRRLEETVNALIEASLSVMTDAERAALSGAVGLDATCVPLFSRGPSKRSGLCASDPDGGWYIRQGDHRDVEGPDGKGLSKIAWALEATICTAAPRVPGQAAGAANLVLGAALDRPGKDPGGTGVRVLASIVSRGYTAGPLGADRAYSAALPERFHLPARALGFTPVTDYRVDQLGVQAQSGGALLIEGAWHCPATPAALVTATKDWRAGSIDHATYDAAHRSARRLPTEAHRGPRRRRLRAPPLPGSRGARRARLPASPAGGSDARRPAQDPRGAGRAAQGVHPDGGDRRPRRRGPPPPGPRLRVRGVGACLRNAQEHHRRAERVSERPRSRGARGAGEAAGARHRRPVAVLRGALARRQPAAAERAPRDGEG
ncbi:MAG: hypothetical protein M0Z69_04125 [Actinomycetota bacterium]|nr:hypothetical protein [Actinomycetota bacterium]